VNAPHDALDLPLDGIRAVQANAGTGKTFTIATLYLRLILSHGLMPAEIVVATFTRAATAELAERLRAWLALVDELLRGADPASPRDGEDSERAVLRRVIGQALQTRTDNGSPASLDTLRKRIDEARLALDTAQISTLHGFCFRVLAELGFEARQSLRPEFDHIDGGNDDLMNRIIWYSVQKSKPYPRKYAGKDEGDD